MYLCTHVCCYVSTVSVGNCAKFLIDMGLELVILYERIYEIYGDILGASNCFAIEAYKQGMCLTAYVHCLVYHVS